MSLTILQTNYRHAAAAIYKSNTANDPLAPYVASFSSRGPNPITLDILKVINSQDFVQIANLLNMIG